MYGTAFLIRTVFMSLTIMSFHDNHDNHESDNHVNICRSCGKLFAMSPKAR